MSLGNRSIREYNEQSGYYIRGITLDTLFVGSFVYNFTILYEEKTEEKPDGNRSIIVDKYPYFISDGDSDVRDLDYRFKGNIYENYSLEKLSELSRKISVLMRNHDHLVKYSKGRGIYTPSQYDTLRKRRSYIDEIVNGRVGSSSKQGVHVVGDTNQLNYILGGDGGCTGTGTGMGHRGDVGGGTGHRDGDVGDDEYELYVRQTCSDGIVYYMPVLTISGKRKFRLTDEVPFDNFLISALINEGKFGMSIDTVVVKRHLESYDLCVQKNKDICDRLMKHKVDDITVGKVARLFKLYKDSMEGIDIYERDASWLSDELVCYYNIHPSLLIYLCRDQITTHDPGLRSVVRVKLVNRIKGLRSRKISESVTNAVQAVEIATGISFDILTVKKVYVCDEPVEFKYTIKIPLSLRKVVENNIVVRLEMMDPDLDDLVFKLPSNATISSLVDYRLIDNILYVSGGMLQVLVDRFGVDVSMSDGLRLLAGRYSVLETVTDIYAMYRTLEGMQDIDITEFNLRKTEEYRRLRNEISTTKTSDKKLLSSVHRFAREIEDHLPAVPNGTTLMTPRDEMDMLLAYYEEKIKINEYDQINEDDLRNRILDVVKNSLIDAISPP